MERLRKYANCTQEIMHPQRKLGMKYCRKKLGMDLATLKTGLNGICEEDLAESSTLSRGKWTINWPGFNDVMMMNLTLVFRPFSPVVKHGFGL